MTASKNAERFDIWLVYLHFIDHPNTGKVRPVLVVDVNGKLIAVAKITSQAPQDGILGEYQLQEWKEAGLNAPSVVRCSQVFEIDETELLRDEPVGCLRQVDIEGVTNALKAVGYFKV
jgi:mRNA-degrading endonuclease toxin of MazEF toxin-antitoxin module